MRLSRFLVAMLALAGVAGCGPQLRPTPGRTTVELSGQWRLPDGVQQTLTAQLRTAIEQMHQRNDEREQKLMRNAMGGQAGPAGGPGGFGGPGGMFEPDAPDATTGAAATAGDGMGPDARGGLSGRNWMMRDRREQTDMLLAMVVPNPGLSITQNAVDDIQIQPEGSALRRFDSRSSSTLVNRLGSFRINAGWQSDTFVVYARDASQGMHVIERYQRVADQLKVQVLFKMSDMKEQVLDATYSLQR